MIVSNLLLLRSAQEQSHRPTDNQGKLRPKKTICMILKIATLCCFERPPYFLIKQAYECRNQWMRVQNVCIYKPMYYRSLLTNWKVKDVAHWGQQITNWFWSFLSFWWLVSSIGSTCFEFFYTFATPEFRLSKPSKRCGTRDYWIWTHWILSVLIWRRNLWVVSQGNAGAETPSSYICAPHTFLHTQSKSYIVSASTTCTTTLSFRKLLDMLDLPFMWVGSSVCACESSVFMNEILDQSEWCSQIPSSVAP